MEDVPGPGEVEDHEVTAGSLTTFVQEYYECVLADLADLFPAELGDMADAADLDELPDGLAAQVRAGLDATPCGS